MNCEIIISLVIGLISGILSSLLFWIVLNFLLTPSIKTDDQIQSNKHKQYIRVYNNSHFNVFEVICYLKYEHFNGSTYFRTDRTLPFLLKRGGMYVVRLDGRSPEKSKKDDFVESFFAQTKGKITVTITYQNRFGIKKTTDPIVLSYSNHDNA